MSQTFRFSEFGYEVEIGKLAMLANGSVWIKKGGTALLVTAVSSSSEEFPGFFPLSVDYREQFAAAGKIPGGYYKREGKPSDKEVLTSRLIDRPIRPLFPADFFDQVQIITTVFSVDQEYNPQILALNGASLALAVSDIPFMGPIGAVEVGRVQGEWVINPLLSERKNSDVRLIVAGTMDGISMVEGQMKGVSESELVDVLFRAHEEIKKSVQWQEEVVAQIGKEKNMPADRWHWQFWQEQASNYLTQDRVAGAYIADKKERNAYLSDLRSGFLEQQAEALSEKDIHRSVAQYIFDDVLKHKINDRIFEIQSRIDGRSFDEIRNIEVDVGILPRAHASAVFTRGLTQALVSLTLGGGQDEQRVESVVDVESKDKAFMLHYNFPPFSVGEARFLRGPGRREVGHGYLAAAALKAVLPDQESFPYTIRLVSDILSSNGSSSMATVCGATMALMDGGVPIADMVSGIAMGLLRNEHGEFAVLSDISGFEDAFGLMDFKIAGTKDRVTAIQLDVKHKGGLPKELFQRAFEQAREGRVHILSKMASVMDKPANNLSEFVPRLVTVQIPVEKIGAVIGGGGKTIREIIEKTGTNIDIDDDGTVKILAAPEADLAAAVEWVKILGGQIEQGMRFDGIVRRIADFGLFIELVPGVDGLVHISLIPRDKQRDMEKTYPIGSVLPVEVMQYEAKTGRIRLKPISAQ